VVHNAWSPPYLQSLCQTPNKTSPPFRFRANQSIGYRVYAHRVGAHIFRYSLATRLLRHGASLSEIAQVLRHRRIETTREYAKVDLEGLRCIAQAWPGMEVVQ